MSGGDDKTIKLWDVEAGKVIDTFLGHTSSITSVSISPDCTTIVSGSWDGTIYLWNISEEQSNPITWLHHQKVNVVSFSPKNSQYIVSASEDGIVGYWSVNDSKNGHTYNGYYAAFSTDGTHFVSCGGSIVTIHKSDSGETVTTFLTPANNLDHCCFSPDDKFVVGAASERIYIWDIANPTPCLIKTFIGHTSFITSLTFSSSLISASDDKTVKFWDIGTLLAGQVATDLISMPIASVSIKSVRVQVDDGIAISSDSAGMIRIWDISTGLCKSSFKTSAKGKRDVQLVDNKLILVWYDWKIGAPGEVHVQDVKKGEGIQKFGQSWSRVLDLKISGDGSMVFLLDHQFIQAWIILTGQLMEKVSHQCQQPSGLIVNGSRVWVSCSVSMAYDFSSSNPRGWDFGIPGSSSILLSNRLPDKPFFNLVNETIQDHSVSTWVEDRVTQERLFCLPKRFSVLTTVLHWDKQYLVIGYQSGEVLVLNFSHVYPK